MLEYALRQERFKGSANTPPSTVVPAVAKQAAEKAQSHGSQLPQTPQNEEFVSAQGLPEAQRNGKGASAPNNHVKLPLGVKDAKGRAKSRAYLQQCLQEIAYLTSATTLNPLAGNTENDPESAMSMPPRPRLSLLENAGNQEGNNANLVQGQNEDPLSQEVLSSKPSVNAEAAPDLPRGTQAAPPVVENAPSAGESASYLVSETPAHAIAESGPIQDAPSPVQPPISVPDVQLWNEKCMLQAHFDSVRAVAFDYVGERLLTASDDATIKHWNVKTGADGVSTDLLATLRGHQAAVTCLVLSKDRQCLYSGSLDSTVRAWKLPLGETGDVPSSGVFASLSRAVWDLALFPCQGQEDAILGTASADGLVSLWWTSPEVSERLHLSWDYFGTNPDERAAEERARLTSIPVPTSITAIPANLRACAVSFSNGVVKTFSLETGKELKRLAAGSLAESDATNNHANMVVAHPTLPLVATAQENSYIHLYDVMTGACTMSLHAHGDSVSCIDIDPSGLTLVSGSHDCTVRFWDIRNPDSRDGPDQGALHASQSHSAVCFQEIRPHQVKANEGVLSVVYHPSAPLVASAGADGALHLFG